MIRHPAKGKRSGHLQEETDRGHGVAVDPAESELGDNGWGIGVKGTLGTVVEKGDGDVDPDAPVGELVINTGQSCSAHRIKKKGPKKEKRERKKTKNKNNIQPA